MGVGDDDETLREVGRRFPNRGGVIVQAAQRGRVFAMAREVDRLRAEAGVFECWTDMVPTPGAMPRSMDK
jgi:hypothetical protein